jgi:class 3 adenylate cyclase
VFRPLDQITQLSPADRSLFLCAIVFSFLSAFWLFFWHGWRFPESAPYLNREFLPTELWIQGAGYGGAWAVLSAFALWARRHAPRSRVLTHATCQLAALWIFTSYVLGHFTFPYLGLLMGFMVFLAALFDARPVLLANVTFYAVLAVTTALEQMKIIPYAPLFNHLSPVADGHLSSQWILGIGGLTVLNWIGFIPLLFFAASRAREREESLTRASKVMSRYLPGQLARQMLAGDAPISVRHERRRLTIFFSDVAEFTNIADELEPEDTSRLLNEYVGAMAEVADRSAATLNQIIGDGLMILFGAPVATSDRDHAERAIAMALAMQDRVSELRRLWKRDGIERDFAVRMGINTGFATVGDFGSEGRVTYTAIGTQTNLAARIEQLCAPGQIWISHSTWALCHDSFDCEEKGEVIVKGIHSPVKLYRVLDSRPRDRRSATPPPA